MIFFTISLQVFATEESSNKRPTASFVDPENKFELLYPSDWEIAPRNSSFPYYGETTEVVFGPKGETVSFKSGHL